MTNQFQIVHNYRQEIKRLRLLIAEMNIAHSRELTRLKNEILRPKCDINHIEAHWTDAMRVCCQMYDVTPDQIIAQTRKQNIVFARHLYTYLCRHHLGMTFNSIGNTLHRDHSTIMHGINVYGNSINYDKPTKKIYDKSVQLLGDYMQERELLQYPHLQVRRGSVEMQEEI